MAEALMSLRPRKVIDYACDEVGNVTYVRKEGSRGKKKRDNYFYAIIHCYRESIRLSRATKSRMTTLVKNYSQHITYRSQAEVSINPMLVVESLHLFLYRG